MSEDIPLYCNYINDSYINIIKNLLKKTNKSYNTNRILYGDLNPSIDYNQILSRMLSNIDSAISNIIESTEDPKKSEISYKLVEECFLKDDNIYDYIITSGMFNEFAKLSSINQTPISEIKNNQKIIIKDMRNIKTSSIKLSEIDDYFTDLELVT